MSALSIKLFFVTYESRKNIFRFAFHDGVITEICPQEREEDWVINFKRGILSTFQNTMSRFDMTHNSIEVCFMLVVIDETTLFHF